MHGGKTPVGIASPHFKHGNRTRYGNALPTSLIRHHEEIQKDEERLSLMQDLDLQDTMLRSALEAMERGEAGELWVRLKEAWKQYQTAKKRQGEQSPEEALAYVGFLISEGYSEYMSRIEVRQMIQERARIVEGESKRMERAQQFVTASQALTFAQSLLQAVIANVPDLSVRAAIQADFLRLTAREAPGVRVGSDPDS